MLQTDENKAGLREREQAALWRKRRDAREPLYQAACWWKLPMLGSRESNKDGQIFDQVWRCCFFFLNYAFFESFQKMAFQIFLLSLVAALIVCHRQVRWLLQQPGFIKVTNSFKMKRVFGLMKIIETIWNHLSWMPPSHPVPPWLYWL